MWSANSNAKIIIRFRFALSVSNNPEHSQMTNMMSGQREWESFEIISLMLFVGFVPLTFKINFKSRLNLSNTLLAVAAAVMMMMNVNLLIRDYSQNDSNQHVKAFRCSIIQLFRCIVKRYIPKGLPLRNMPWSYLVNGDVGCIGSKGKLLLCLWQTKKVHHMYRGNITCLTWANLVVIIYLLKSSMHKHMPSDTAFDPR